MEDENVYTRLPSDTVKQLDIKCAELRIKRPAAIATAVKEWLSSGGQGNETNKPLFPLDYSPMARYHPDIKDAADKISQATRALGEALAALNSGTEESTSGEPGSESTEEFEQRMSDHADEGERLLGEAIKDQAEFREIQENPQRHGKRGGRKSSGGAA